MPLWRKSRSHFRHSTLVSTFKLFHPNQWWLLTSQKVHTNFYAKFGVCSSKNGWYIAQGTIEDILGGPKLFFSNFKVWTIEDFFKLSVLAYFTIYFSLFLFSFYVVYDLLGKKYINSILILCGCCCKFKTK